MSILDAFNRNYQSYTDQVYGPGGYYTTSPSRMDYNINANRAATELMSNTLQQGLGSFGTPAAAIAELAAPAIAFGASPFHDITQAAQRAKESYDMPTGYGTIYDYMETPVGPTMSEFAKAVAAEQIPSTMIQRAMGAAVPLSNRIQTGLDLIGNFGFGTPAEDFLGTSTPTEISIPEAPKIFSPTQDFNFLPSAYEDETLGEDVGSTKSKFGIENLLEKALGFAVPGLSFLQNIAGGGQPYEQFTPGGTIRNGIYSIDGVNVPVSSFGGDFYNPNTGLNRFDRAAERFKKTGSMADLFASSRTGKEFFEKRREIQAQKQKKLEDAAKAKIKFKQDTSGGGGGGGGTHTATKSASQAAANREGRRGGQYR